MESSGPCIHWTQDETLSPSAIPVLIFPLREELPETNLHAHKVRPGPTPPIPPPRRPELPSEFQQAPAAALGKMIGATCSISASTRMLSASVDLHWLACLAHAPRSGAAPVYNHEAVPVETPNYHLLLVSLQMSTPSCGEARAPEPAEQGKSFARMKRRTLTPTDSPSGEALDRSALHAYRYFKPVDEDQSLRLLHTF